MILAIDQGTTGTHLHRLRRGGPAGGPRLPRVRPALPPPRLGRARRQRDLGGHPRGGARGARGRGPARRSRGIGITNQRETVVAWDPRTGEPLHRAIVWQDRRTAARCDELREAGPRAALPRAHRAGARPVLLRAPRSSGCAARAGWATGAVFGTIDSWLAYKLTGRHVTDYSNASRTLLFDIRRARLGPRAVRAPRRGSGVAARAAAERRRVRRDERARRLGAGGRDRRRPAGRALRAGLPLARARQEHVRHRQLRAPERGQRGARRPRTGCSPPSPGAWRAAWTTRSRRRSS